MLEKEKKITTTRTTTTITCSGSRHLMCFKNSFSEDYKKIPWKTSVVKSLELQNTELLQNNSAERKAYK